MVKKEMVWFLDIGLDATFVRFVPHPSEEDFLYLEYCPLDTFPAKTVRYEKPIKKSAIHTINPLLHLKGMADRLVVIYTAEPGSIINKVLSEDSIKALAELKNKVKSLEMKNASLVQEVENARSGVSKAIASSRNLSKTSTDSSKSLSIFDKLKERSNPFDNN